MFWVFVIIGLEPGGSERGKDENGEDKKKKKKRKDDWGVGAQALLLIDPGAELDWAELSGTLPSVVEKAQTLICTFTRESTKIA